MSDFCSLFQSNISSDSYIEYDLADLLEASSQASTAQYPLNAKKVDSVVKSVVKSGNLLIAPMIASFEGKDYTVSGRHRTEAARIICEKYGINAKGKVVLKDEVVTLEPITPRVRVDYVVVKDLATLSALILASNESRTMTGPEKSSVKTFGGYATPGDKFKLRFSPILSKALSLTDEGGQPIVVTAITLASIASKCASVIKPLKSATDDQLRILASHLNEYLNDDCALPVKFAQYHGSFIADFLSNDVELVDEDGEAVQQYDEAGDEITLSYAEHFTSQIVVEPKVAKAGKKVSIDLAQYEAMQAKLLEMGVSL
jgi:hypothetical protein